MIGAVLFDLDGTLVDSNAYHVEAWVLAFAELGHAVPREAIAGQIGKGGDLLVPSMLPELSDRDQKRVADRHGELFQARWLDQVRPFPQASALVRRVRQAGARVVLASSAQSAELDHHVRLLGIEDAVDARVTIDDVAKSKPAADIFAAALAKAKVKASDALAVGDTPYDIASAAAVGVRTVAVRSGGFPDEALAGAVAIYDGVAALLTEFDSSPLAG